jgi:hypothetical protein
VPFYVYVFDTWSLVAIALDIWCHPLVHGAPIQLFAVGASHNLSCSSPFLWLGWPLEVASFSLV